MDIKFQVIEITSKQYADLAMKEEPRTFTTLYNIKLVREGCVYKWGDEGHISLAITEKKVADQFTVGSSYKVSFDEIIVLSRQGTM